MCEIYNVVRWGRQRRGEQNNHVRRLDNNRLVEIAETKLTGCPPDTWQLISQEQYQKQYLPVKQP